MEAIDWNGIDLPKELRELPPGKYIVMEADDLAEISAPEEERIRAALRSLEDGRGISHDAVKARIRAKLDR